MGKLLLVLLLLLVIYFVFFRWRPPRRPPGDWRRGDGDTGPLAPGLFIDSERHPRGPSEKDQTPAPEPAMSGSEAGSGDGGGD